MIALLFIPLVSPAACLTVDSSQVLAAHLAPRIPAFGGLPSDTIIGYSPAPGLTRLWRGSQLRQLAQRHGIDPGETADFCVERPAHVVEQPEVLDALKRALPAGARLELVDYCRMPMPTGKLQFELKGLTRSANPSPQAVLIWRGRLMYEARRSVPFWASVRVAIEKTGYYAARPITAGKVLEAEDAIKESRTVSILDPETASALDDLVGREARRAIVAGSPLVSDLFSSPRVVLPGDALTVSVESGAARVTMDARAATGGRRGDEILIENQQSGKKFKATVEGKGRAAVRLEDQHVEANPARTRSGSATLRR